MQTRCKDVKLNKITRIVSVKTKLYKTNYRKATLFLYLQALKWCERAWISLAPHFSQLPKLRRKVSVSPHRVPRIGPWIKNLAHLISSRTLFNLTVCRWHQVRSCSKVNSHRHSLQRRSTTQVSETERHTLTRHRSWRIHPATSSEQVKYSSSNETDPNSVPREVSHSWRT